jgi:hypothetical protein
MLTGNDTDLDKTHYSKVVDNFDTFPESIYTPSSDERSRSNDLWKWREVAEISIFWTDSCQLTNSAFGPLFQRKPIKLKTPKL